VVRDAAGTACSLGSLRQVSLRPLAGLHVATSYGISALKLPDYMLL